MNKIAYAAIAAVAALAVGWYYLGAGGLGGTSVRVGSDGVSVDANGTSVRTGPDGVQVNTPGANVQTGGEANGSSARVDPQKKNAVIIVDASGSMNKVLGSQTKLDLMKSSVGTLLDKMSPDTNLDVIAYGHKGSNSEADKPLSCAGIEELSKLGESAEQLASDVNALQAKGWTPLAASLEKAKAILAQYPKGDNEVFLLSDGEETCGGNPALVAKALCDAGVRVDVLGLDVNDAQSEQLKDISVKGCGAYASVGSAEDLNVIVGSGGLRVNAPGATVNIQNGSMQVITDGATFNASDGNVDVEAGGVKFKTNGGSMPTVDYSGAL